MSKTIVKVDSQILNAFSQCERLMELSFIHNYWPLESSFSLQRGSLIHDINEEFYTSYKSSKNRLNSVSKALELGRARINHYDAIDVPRGMEILENLREYFNYYSNERWLPIDIEEIHKKVIFEDDDIIILYVTKIDLTVLDVNASGESERLVVDHKTYDRWFEPLALENQFTGYCYVKGIKKLVVNKIGFQKTYPPDKKFRRVTLVYNDTKFEEWIHNTARLVKDMVFSIENNSFPMRTTQCGMYGGCKMLPICSVDPRARQGVIDKLYKINEPWDPEKIKDE